jgi:hypothetical protein
VCVKVERHNRLAATIPLRVARLSIQYSAKEAIVTGYRPKHFTFQCRKDTKKPFEWYASTTVGSGDIRDSVPNGTIRVVVRLLRSDGFLT